MTTNHISTMIAALAPAQLRPNPPPAAEPLPPPPPPRVPTALRLARIRAAVAEIRALPEPQRRWHAAHEVDWTPRLLQHADAELMSAHADELFAALNACFRAVPSTGAAASIFALFTRVLRDPETPPRTLRALRARETEFVGLPPSARAGFLETVCATSWARAHRERGWRELAARVEPRLRPAPLQRHIFADELPAELVDPPQWMVRIWRPEPRRRSRRVSVF